MLSACTALPQQWQKQPAVLSHVCRAALSSSTQIDCDGCWHADRELLRCEGGGSGSLRGARASGCREPSTRRHQCLADEQAMVRAPGCNHAASGRGWREASCPIHGTVRRRAIEAAGAVTAIADALGRAPRSWYAGNAGETRSGVTSASPPACGRPLQWLPVPYHRLRRPGQGCSVQAHVRCPCTQLLFGAGVNRCWTVCG